MMSFGKNYRNSTKKREQEEKWRIRENHQLNDY